MKYLRKWDLLTLEEPVCEHLDYPEGWGQHYFWYCFRCRSIYASAVISPEDLSARPWQSLGGLCLTCKPDLWHIRGTIESVITTGWNVPLEVAMYQLDREIDFLCHGNHPHNKEKENG